MRRAGAMTFAVAWLLVAAAAARAADLTPAQRAGVLDEAQAAYDRGVSVVRKDPAAAREAFEESARRFQQLIDDGVETGPLRYNLGNAHLQAGDLGRAILEYRRAEELTPGDPRLAHNLEHARSLRRNRLAALGRRALAAKLLGWHDHLSAGSRFALFAAAWIIFWGALLATRWRPGASWWWVAAATALVWCAAGSSLAVTWWGGEGPPEGVTLVDDIVVRKGNGMGYEPQFAEPLHRGVELVVLAERGGWMQIELPDGSTGWIPASAVGLVGDLPAALDERSQ